MKNSSERATVISKKPLSKKRKDKKTRTVMRNSIDASSFHVQMNITADFAEKKKSSKLLTVPKEKFIFMELVKPLTFSNQLSENITSKSGSEMKVKKEKKVKKHKKKSKIEKTGKPKLAKTIEIIELGDEELITNEFHMSDCFTKKKTKHISFSDKSDSEEELTTRNMLPEFKNKELALNLKNKFETTFDARHPTKCIII